MVASTHNNFLFILKLHFYFWPTLSGHV